MSKISGPLMDRIDIQCEISPVPFEDISKQVDGEQSEKIRARVIKARKIQEERYKECTLVHCNVQNAIEMLKTAMKCFSLSARAYSRILKVARTITNLAGTCR